jgi:hypothetical protein
MNARLVAALSWVAAGCALVRTTDDAAGGASGGPLGGGGALVGGEPDGGAPEGGLGGLGGAGGVEVMPSLPPCFPLGVDDFSDPATSEALWSPANAAFVGGRALLGVIPDELAVIGVESTLDGACFVSFVIEPTPDGDEAFDAYVLLKPAFTNAFDDLDVNVTPDDVKLYVRPTREPIRSVARTGERFLLILEDSSATLYQTTSDGSAWSFAAALETPSPLADTQLSFTHYDATPAFFVDDVSVLPPELAALPSSD